MKNSQDTSRYSEEKETKVAYRKRRSNKKEIYDIIVIGAGSGGLSIGLSMHKLGFDVLMIDRNDKAIGGECLNTGCIPSKALIHVSRKIHSTRQSKSFGISLENEEVNWEKVKQYIREKQDIIRTHENASYFENEGIDIALGEARFVSNDTVEVQSKLYKGRKIVIATGSKPTKLKVPGVDKVKYYDNENIFDLGFIPENLLVVGGGPISMELGQAFQRLGSQVTIVHNAAMIMTKEDTSIAGILKQKLEEEGVRFLLDAEVNEFTSPNEALIKQKNGIQSLLNFDAVLVGIGRDLDFSNLNLENAGVKLKEGKIVTDKFLRTTNKKVYVSGDAAGTLFFSHAAELHATLLINNFLSPLKKKLNFDTFPWVTFTEPEIATFGLSENQLINAGKNFEKHILDFGEDDRAVVGEYQYGKLIMYTEKSTFFPGNSRILGGSMIAPNVGEMVQELILANSAGIKSGEIFNKIYAYPTAGRVNKTLMINRYNDFLSPFIKKIIQIFYRL